MRYPTVTATFNTTSVVSTGVLEPLPLFPGLSGVVIQRRPLLFPRRVNTTVILPGVLGY